MATQGMVSVVQDGKVLFKVIVGSEGMKADEMAQVIAAADLTKLTVESIYDIAKHIGFGGEYNLVVLGQNRQFKFEGDEDLDPRYFDTFDDPRFNPRWECGLCEYTSILNV